MANLLNPSFEGDGHGEWTRATHSGQEFGNWFTPERYVGWWNPRKPRPEAHVIPFLPPFIGPPARVYDGHWSCKLHKSFGVWEGGHYQIVDGLEVGATYEADFYAHAWTNHDGLPNAGDPNCAPMGCGPLYRLESELPPLSGDPVQDAWWAALFQVGVQFLDPGQNPDPTYNVLWGDAAAIYNAFARVPTLAFEAMKERIAYFIRCSFKWSYRNNDAYVDLARLEKVGTPPPSRTYERTYVLLPNNQPFDPAEQQRITALNPGKSVGPSADDSAIGHPNLTKTTIISYKPQTWGGKDALEAFWREYYNFPRPQDTIIYREDDEPPPPNPILLWQRDPEWAGVPLAYAGCSSTIGQQGCFISNLGMSQRFYSIDADATPVTVQEALGPQGFSGCVANWVGQPQLYKDTLKLSIRLGSELDAIEHMDKGFCTMAEILPTSVEHFFLVYKEDGGYIALDPWDNVERPFALSEAQSWRILTRVEPPAPDPKGRIGLHLQQEVGDWRGMSAVTIPMKFLAGIQNITTVKQINPDSFPAWRQWVPNQGIYLENPNHDAGANAYLDTFRDSMEEVLEEIARTMPGLQKPWFGVESLNETYAHGDPKVVTQSIPFDRAWIRALASYPEVSPVVYCAAVGNIELPRDVPGSQAWKDLVTMAKEGEAQNAAWGYHAYWYANPTESGLVSDWDYLAGRWTLFDDYLVTNGARVNWFFGECGAVGGHAWPSGGYNLLPNDGWKASTCYAGNWPRYEQDLLLFNSLVQEWNATHGGRALGGTIFTTGGGDKWKWFEIGEQQIARLIAIL